MTPKQRRKYEAGEQKAFVAHVRMRGDKPMAAGNGAPLLNGARSWRHLEAMGAATGFPDVAIHGPAGKPSLFVEMKSPGEELSEDQAMWREHLAGLGHWHCTAYEALGAIDAYEKWRNEVRR